jgi:CHAT domain-containing protein/tetratricopeptide (TPR) repeat protein
MDQELAVEFIAFLAEQYEDCIDGLINKEPLSFTAYQLILISAIRTENAGFARTVLERFLAESSNPMQAQLMMLSLGVSGIDPAELKAAATSDIEFSWVHFYTAEWLRTFHQNDDAARGAYLAAALTSAGTPEQALAEAMCAANGDSTRLAEHRLANLYEEAQDLIGRGRGFETVPIWSEALRIADSAPDISRGVTAVAQCNLGLRLEEACDYERGLTYLEPAFETLIEMFGPERQELPLLARATGRCCLALKNFDRALERFRTAHELLTMRGGPKAFQTIVALDDIGYAYEVMGSFDEAQKILEEVLTLKTESLGPDDERTVDSRDLLTSLLEIAKGHRTPKSEWTRLLDIFDERFRNFLERGDREGAKYLVEKMRDFVSTIPTDHRLEGLEALYALFKDAESQSEVQIELLCSSACAQTAAQLFGTTDSRSITLLSNLAEAHRKAEEFELALRINEECLELRRAAFGSDHPDVALSLNNLSQVYQAMGRHQVALDLMQMALRIDEQAFGQLHDSVAGDLNNIGLALYGIGEYSEARAKYWRAIEIWRELHPDGHAHLGLALLNLGNSYGRLGDMVAAELCFVQSRRMLSDRVGQFHPGALTAFASIAQLSPHDHNEEDLSKILASAEGALGAQNSFLAAIKADRKVVKPSDLDTILACLRERVGDSHPNAVKVATARVHQLSAAKNFSAAKEALIELIENPVVIQGAKPLDAATLYWKLSALDIATVDIVAALDHAKTAIRLFGNAWERFAPVVSEKGSAALIFLGKRLIDLTLNLLVDHLTDSEEAAQLALHATLRYKQLPTSLRTRERAAAASETDPGIREKFTTLRSMREKMINELMIGPECRGALFASEEISGWQLDYRQISEQLSEMLISKQKGRTVSSDLLDSVCQLLPADTGLIEYIQFDRIAFTEDPLADWTSVAAWFNPPRYAAFLLRSAPAENVVWASVGSRSDLFILSNDLRRLIDPQRAAEDPGPRGFEQLPVPDSWQDAALALRSAVLDPIDGVWTCDRLIISPDGYLANIPFEILPDVSGESIFEKRHVSYLATSRDLVDLKKGADAATTEAIVIADPAFDAVEDSRSVSELTLRAFGTAINSSAIEQQISRYSRLGGTLREGQEIAKIIGAKLFVGQDANRAQIASLRSPRILHIATHAFFPEFAGGGAVDDQIVDALNLATLPDVIKDSNAALKSGLVLAGGNWKSLIARKLVRMGEALIGNDDDWSADLTPSDNHEPNEDSITYFKLAQFLPPRLQRKSLHLKRLQRAMNKALELIHKKDNQIPADFCLPPQSCGNGILTAEEVAWLELKGTELVVLSACGTGLGLYELGDGLSGLRRSFFVAGARRLVCSLWPVPDEQTVILMRAFYTAISDGARVDDALKKAKLTLKATYPNEPYYWAAFVLFGDPSTIPGFVPQSVRPN